MFESNRLVMSLRKTGQGLTALLCIGTWAHAAVQPGEDLQAVLDRGADLQLQKGAVYEITQTLKYKKPGQKIYTVGATNISEYATLLLANPEQLEMINAKGVAGACLEKVVVDGNRYRLSAPRKIAKAPQPPLIFFGGNGAEGQVVRDNVLRSTRSWSTLKIHEGGDHILVENNLILGAGVDPRGNGREAREVAFSWGDAISCGARNTIIRNNLILDPTDVGIVLYGAPGSLVESNVVASVSRESLGGINLVDPLPYYALDEAKKRVDYRGDRVRHNFIDARGARIHIGVPMGGPIWGPRLIGTVLVGAEVYENTMSGDAAAYGFVVNGVDGFRVHDNLSIAAYSGRGEGLKAGNPPDEPGPFLFDPKQIGDSALQSEFKPCEKYLVHLLRCNHGPTNELGYRVYAYGDAEVKAVITTAYLEMLQRAPNPAELATQVRWLQESKRTADELRKQLMAGDEFVRRFGVVAPDDLQLYRQKLWFDSLSAEQLLAKGATPSARALYEGVLRRFQANAGPATAAETQPPSGNFDLSHWKLTLPAPAAGANGGSPAEIPASQLNAGYRNSRYFYAGPNGEMVFWCPVNGVTTGGSEFPRSELRELIDPADDNVCWAAPGTHILNARCRVSGVPSSQKVVIGQIHSYSGKAKPLIKLQFFKNRIEAMVKVSPKKGKDIKLSFPQVGLDKDFDYQIKLQDGLLSVTVNGTTRTENVFQNAPEWASQSLYFKAGAYVQDNEGSASEGARVSFSKLQTSHAGVL